MKCFTHRNTEAVAVCRSCGRALCPDCIADVGLSCACKNRCEATVASFNAMLTRGAPGKIGAAMPLGYDRLIFLLVLGLTFVCFGVHNFGAHGVNWFFVAFGVLFFIYGISQFYTAKKFRDKMRDQKS